MSPRDWFDLAILLFLAVGMVWGFLRGFLSSFAFLLATVSGIWGARHFQESALKLCGLEPSWIARSLAFFVLFALISMLVHQFMNILERFVEKQRLMTWNRILGMVYGTGFSLAVCWIFAWFLTEFPQTRLAVTHSRSARYLVVLAEFSQEVQAQKGTHAISESLESVRTGTASRAGNSAGNSVGNSAGNAGADPDSDLDSEALASSIRDTFIERVQEDAAIPKQEPPQTEGKSSALPGFLDSLDEKMSGILPEDQR